MNLYIYLLLAMIDVKLKFTFKKKMNIIYNTLFYSPRINYQSIKVIKTAGYIIVFYVIFRKHSGPILFSLTI